MIGAMVALVLLTAACAKAFRLRQDADLIDYRVDSNRKIFQIIHFQNLRRVPAQ
jgi:hypothetical protein